MLYIYTVRQQINLKTKNHGKGSFTRCKMPTLQ